MADVVVSDVAAMAIAAAIEKQTDLLILALSAQFGPSSVEQPYSVGHSLERIKSAVSSLEREMQLMRGVQQNMSIPLNNMTGALMSQTAIAAKAAATADVLAVAQMKDMSFHQQACNDSLVRNGIPKVQPPDFEVMVKEQIADTVKYASLTELQNNITGLVTDMFSMLTKMIMDLLFITQAKELITNFFNGIKTAIGDGICWMNAKVTDIRNEIQRSATNNAPGPTPPVSIDKIVC